METNKILNADILDIIFDGKNKAYGAYDLRKTYNKRIALALGGTLALIAILFTSSIVAKSLKSEKKAEIIVEDVALEDVKKEDKKNEPPPPPPPPRQEPPKVEITKFTPPKIVKDEEVKEDDKPPEQEKLDDTKIGKINQEGEKDEGKVIAPVESGTGTVAAPKVEEDYDKVFTTVQIESEFPGGPEAWSKYLQKNLNSDAPTSNGAPPGRYTVVLSFKVDKNGAVSDINVEKDPGYGTKEEAIRVIKRGPSWKPANQNGRLVTSIKKQAITFLVNEE
jgi:periplasmic protein TonB